MITIRKANVEDLESVFELIIAIALYHDQLGALKTSKAKFCQAAFGKNPEVEILIAEENGRTLGFISYSWNYSIWLGEKYMHIDDMFVSPEYRGKKVGERLLMGAKCECRKLGLNQLKWEVEANNYDAIRFYERNGATIDVKGIGRLNANQL